MHWTEKNAIAIELTEARPDVDPITLSFAGLRNWLLALPGFDSDRDRCGERILQAIQAAWVEELH
jgi:FeS assembly protein IscX